MTLTFWVADYPDGSDFFQALVSCAADIPGGQNYSFYCNKKVDSDVNAGLANPSSAQSDYVAGRQDPAGRQPGRPAVLRHHHRGQRRRGRRLLRQPDLGLGDGLLLADKPGSGKSSAAGGLGG